MKKGRALLAHQMEFGQRYWNANPYRVSWKKDQETRNST